MWHMIGYQFAECDGCPDWGRKMLILSETPDFTSFGEFPV